MNEMIERVAMALAKRTSPLTWEGMLGFVGGADLRERYLADARTAIEAMREPTEAMEIRGGSVDWDAYLTIGPTNAACVWRHMIDDALKEP